MSDRNRLPDYLAHIRQAALDARSFVDGMSRDEFLSDKRTQNAVVMSLVIMGEAAAKVMDQHPEFAQLHAGIPWRGMRGMRNRIAHGSSRSTLIWFGIPSRQRFRHFSCISALGRKARRDWQTQLIRRIETASSSI
jgi:uncharacterized protein with HEPN domain